MKKHVKKRIKEGVCIAARVNPSPWLIWLLAALFTLAVQGRAEDAKEILKNVRLAQSEQSREVQGRLRNGKNIIPFRLKLDKGVLRYEFTGPDQVIILRFGEESSRLEEITDGNREKITPAQYDARVRNTDITYEDLALKFLYWPRAQIEGEETKLTRKCWKMLLEPGSRKESQYGKVTVWIEKQSGALMQAEGYDWDGKLSKRFKVISGQKIDGGWFLKQMRIEHIEGGKAKDKAPTYLEINRISD